MFWNSKTTTYYSRGRKAYGMGDEIPPDVIEQMGKETFDEYREKGWIDDGTAAAEIKAAELKAKAEAEAKAAAEAEKEAIEKAEAEENALRERATKYGLKPHYRAGVEKLKEMIADYEALQDLKKEALALGIDPSDDVDFAKLTELVNEKKAQKTLGDAGKKGG